MKKHLFTLLLAALAAFQLNAQCDPGQSEVRLEVTPDYYWQEVSWKLTNVAGNLTYATGNLAGSGLQIFTYCVPNDECVIFHMMDSYGDGMAPDGIYRLYVDDVLIKENIGFNYGHGENTSFNCPPGSFCDNPLALNLGQYATADGSNTWYSFVPAETGTYQISTCELGNNCPTKIWVYDHCAGISITNNNLGTLFYADGGCANDPNGAVATLYLAGGQVYFVRIGYANGICNDQPINFTLSYEGPVVGCTDPEACNYQPLATVSGPCIYPGDPDCGDLPDLMVREDVLRNTLTPTIVPNADACAVEEGCIRGFGDRMTLRFTTQIQNIGVADYFIGETPPTPDTPSDQFVWDPCHNHWHYRGYAEYVLFDANGVSVPVGSKNGFCVLDLECSGGGVGKFTCGNMGITAGCGDIYDSGLPCQWVDITGIPAGLYTLVVRVNWDKTPDKTGRPEITYDNNWAQACFTIEYDNNGLPLVDVVDDCPQFTDCLGEVFGSAQPDCKGICNGPTLRGDWNEDLVRNDTDIAAYVDAAITDNDNATACNDLDASATLDVFDAALLQECTLHGDDPQYWGTRFPCQFPTGTMNPKDIVYLLPGMLDQNAKTFDIQIVNPYFKLYGFEFNVSGLHITGVEKLEDNFGAEWQFNAATGKLLALTATEQPLKKNILPTAFLRLHYDELTSDSAQVCISGITAIVNEKYVRSNALLADPNCVSTGASATLDPSQQAFRAIAIPNPAADQFGIFFDNPGAEPVNVTLSDAAGHPLRVFKGVREESVTIERGDLPAGLYLFRVEGSRGRVTGKVVVE